MNILYIVLGIIGLWIVWSVIKVSTGGISMKKDPIGTGVLYLKTHLKNKNLKYIQLIPDGVLRELAETAQGMAELTHEMHNEAFVTEYVQGLNHFVVQIDGIMKGLDTVVGLPGGDSVARETLEKYGVKIPM